MYIPLAIVLDPLLRYRPWYYAICPLSLILPTAALEAIGRRVKEVTVVCDGQDERHDLLGER